MKFKLDKDKVTIENYDVINSGSLHYYLADVEASEDWDNLVIEAIMQQAGTDTGITHTVIDNQFYMDIDMNGIYLIGFIGYTIEDEKKVMQISTDLVKLVVNTGAGEIKVTQSTPSASEFTIFVEGVKNRLDELNNEEVGDTIDDKIDYTEESKELIKEAIEFQDVEVLETDTFRDYATRIRQIKAIPDVEEKTVKSTEEEQIVYPTGDKLINKITVEPINLQEKTVTPTTSSQTIEPDANYDALSQVDIEAIQTEAVGVKSTEQEQTLYPTTGKYINEINVMPMELQNKTVTPTTQDQEITADVNKDALKKVTVEAVDNTIDSNIVSDNIRSGVTILGVSGKDTVVDTSDATATASDIMENKTAYVDGQKVTGTMEDVSSTIDAQDTLISELQEELNNKAGISAMSATAYPQDIASGKTAYCRGEMITGTKEDIDLTDYFTATISPGTSSSAGVLKTIKSIPENIQISGNNCNYMFDNCLNLNTIPLIDTSNVEYMENMFQNCTNLQNIPQINTSNVREMGNMFSGCTLLTTIPLIDTNNVSRFNGMFKNCTNLHSIPLIDTSGANNMNAMFSGCTLLVTVPVLNTSSVAFMSNMFSECTSLSNESLNNILQMCINTTNVSNKTLSYLGLSATQKATCQTLSNWQAFLDAGWTA